MPPDQMTRRSYFSALRQQNVHAIFVAGVLGLYALLGFVRDDILPYGVDKKWWSASIQAHLTVLDFLGAASWQAWLILALIMAVILVFEASFRIQRHSRETRDGLHSEIAELKGHKALA